MINQQGIKDKFTQRCKSSCYLLTRLSMESREKFRSSIDLQPNSVAAFS